MNTVKALGQIAGPPTAESRNAFAPLSHGVATLESAAATVWQTAQDMQNQGTACFEATAVRRAHFRRWNDQRLRHVAAPVTHHG